MLPEPTYITAQEVKEESLIAGLISLGDGDIDKLIKAAEGQIDDYVGRQPHHPYDTNFERVFPREQDYQITFVSGLRYDYRDIPVIPLAVSEATLRQVEWLYTQWWSVSATAQLPLNKPVESEEIGGDGSYNVDYAGAGRAFAEASLCDQSKAKLSGFHKGTARMVVTDPDDVPPFYAR